MTADIVLPRWGKLRAPLNLLGKFQGSLRGVKKRGKGEEREGKRKGVKKMEGRDGRPHLVIIVINRSVLTSVELY